MPEPTRPDGLDLNKDGTITAHIDGERYHLRRPKTREYKAFLLASRSRDDEMEEMRSTARAATPLGDKAADELDDAEKLEVEEASRSLNRRLADRQGELDRDWIRTVFSGSADGDIAGLSDKPLPEDADDWPVWIWQAENLTRFLEHWRAVPLVRGT